MKRNLLLDKLAYVALRVIVAIVQSSSLECCHRWCRLGAYALAHWIPLRRRTVDDNLRMVMPSATKQELATLRERMWEHLLLMICEVAHAPLRIHRRSWYEHFYIPQKNELFRIIMGKRPTVLVTGHFGNFELAGFATGMFGIQTTTIARPLDNRYVHDYVTAFRSLGGQHMLDKEGSAAPVQAILEQGGTLALLADQHAGPKGCWTEFLGQPASCHKALALFVLTSGAAMVTAYNRRLDRPLRFEMGSTGIALPDDTGEHMQGVKNLTAWYNRSLEKIIRAHPDQYWWLHRRWREPPPKKAAQPKTAAAA